MNKTRSKVMTIANRLVKQGLTRSIATVKAWVIVKADVLRTKVKGTSHRQNALEKLAGVNPADISVKLKREPHNCSLPRKTQKNDKQNTKTPLQNTNNWYKGVGFSFQRSV